MSDRAPDAEAVTKARLSVTEYWTRFYAQADTDTSTDTVGAAGVGAGGSFCLSVAQDCDLARHYDDTGRTLGDD